MSDTEFSRLMSELSATAKVLNAKSDSVNALIERFEATLRSMNVGIEVWPVSLDSAKWMDTRNDKEYERGKIDTELGFVKHLGEWKLATRVAYYDDNDYRRSVRIEAVTPLLEGSRDTRLEALKAFPQIATSLKDAADDAIKAIDDAEQFVK